MNSSTSRSRSRLRNGADSEDRKQIRNDKILLNWPFEVEDRTEGDSITITKRDYIQLSPPKLLNDNIITFFMQYHLETEVSDDVKRQIHVFNSFFFSKIKTIANSEDGDMKTLKSASRWLKGVEIFTKDFLIIPICDRDHWILVIICYPGNQPIYTNRSLNDECLYEPAVFVLNSIPGSTPKLKKTLNRFLQHQWKIERHNRRLFPIHSSKKSGIRLIFPDIPQQKNSYNCGLYMLNYFYCFLKDPRRTYLRMFRCRNLTHWFLENNIDIHRERRRMMKQIDDLAVRYDNTRSSTSTNGKRSKMTQEIVIDSPARSDNSSPTLMEVKSCQNDSVIVIN